MEISPLQEDELETFIDELWIKAQHEMATVSEHTLVDDIRSDGLSHRRSRLSDDDSITFLARDGNRLIGFLAAEIQTPPPIFQQVRECHIDELFVSEEARRQGIATKLLERGEEWADRHDRERLDLNVHHENHSAKRLYEKVGYNVKRYNMKKRLTGDR